jgi:hypothetical protein
VKRWFEFSENFQRVSARGSSSVSNMTEFTDSFDLPFVEPPFPFAGRKVTFTSTGSFLKFSGSDMQSLMEVIEIDQPAPRNSKLAGDILSPQAHIDIRVGVVIDQPGIREILFPPIGTMDMDSVPPATITSAPPPRARS